MSIIFLDNGPAWKKKIEDHNDRKRENHLRRQRTSSLASQTPKKKRGRPKKNQEQVANSEAVENFKPKIDKVEKVAPPPRRFGAAKFKENSALDRTLKGMKELILKAPNQFFEEQNKLFDDLNKESPTIDLKNGPKSMLNVGGSKIFEVPSNTVDDVAQKEVSEKRKCNLSKN